MLKRIVVTGATGNVGTSVVRGLAADPLVGSVVGIARRRPEWMVDNVTWHTADLADVLGARVVKLPVQPARMALTAAWRLHLTPASPDR